MSIPSRSATPLSLITQSAFHSEIVIEKKEPEIVSEEKITWIRQQYINAGAYYCPTDLCAERPCFVIGVSFFILILFIFLASTGGWLKIEKPGGDRDYLLYDDGRTIDWDSS